MSDMPKELWVSDYECDGDIFYEAVSWESEILQSTKYIRADTQPITNPTQKTIERSKQMSRDILQSTKYTRTDTQPMTKEVLEGMKREPRNYTIDGVTEYQNGYDTGYNAAINDIIKLIEDLKND